MGLYTHTHTHTSNFRGQLPKNAQVEGVWTSRSKKVRKQIEAVMGSAAFAYNERPGIYFSEIKMWMGY